MNKIFKKNLHQISKFGNTPEGWREICVRDVCNLGRGRVISHEEIRSNPGPYPVYSSQTSDDGLMGSLGSYEFNCELITWTTDGANAGTVFFRQGKFNCTNVCGTLTAKSANDIDLRFLTYQIGHIAKRYVSYHGNPKLMNDVMGNVALIIPSQKAEQRKISIILSTIDQAIEKTEALIQKYQHIKAGLMHDLFTRGLTADGKLRPCREQAPELYQETLIGWIPGGWEVDFIGNAFYIQLGKMLSKAAKTGKWKANYLGNKNVQWDRVDLIDLETMDFNYTEREKFNLLFGDLLVCEGGDVGRTSMWRDEIRECYYQKAIHRLRPSNGRVKPAFMLRFMRYAKQTNVFSDFTSQSSIAHLTQEKLAKVKMFIPSLSEQTLMIERFDSVDKLINEESAFLEKLKVKKSGLMHDLLSGKVQVTIDPETTHHG